MFNFRKILFLFLFATILVFSGCKSEKINNADMAPGFPTYRTFELNIESLDSNNVPSNLKGYDINWYVAYLKVVFWKQFINEYLKVPFYALNECYKVEPEFFADKTWVRETEFLLDSNTYDISLYGTFLPDTSVDWEMYFTLNKETSFLMIKGNQNRDKTIGSWTFYQYIFSPVETLKVEWIQTDSSFNVSYINIYDKSMYKGSKLNLYYFNYDENNPRLNLYLDFYNSLENNTTYVQLDSMSYYGRIRDSLFYLNNDWHYWGE